MNINKYMYIHTHISIDIKEFLAEFICFSCKIDLIFIKKKSRQFINNSSPSNQKLYRLEEQKNNNIL